MTSTPRVLLLESLQSTLGVMWPARFQNRHESMPCCVKPLVLSLLIFGCSRYELRNELDVPGVCDRRPTTISADVAWHRDTTRTTVPSVHGTVRDRISKGGLNQALVRLRTATSEPVVVKTDSMGAFDADPVPPGRYVVEIFRVGYKRAIDTLDLSAGSSMTVDVQLQHQVFDGTCSGLLAVMVRKPWWKIW